MGVRSGTVEPTWKAEEGALVFEDVTATGETIAPPTDVIISPPLPDDVRDRYRPPGGGGGVNEQQ